MYTKLAVEQDHGASIVSPQVAASEVNLNGFVTFIEYDSGQFYVGLGNGQLHVVSESNGLTALSDKPFATEGLPMCGAASPGSGTVFIGTDRGQVLAYADEPGVFADLNKGWVEQISCDPTGQFVAFSSGKRVFVKQVATGAPVVETEQAQGVVMGLAFSADGKSLAIARYGGVSVLDMATGKERQQLSWQGAHLNLSWSPDGHYLVTSTPDKELHCWDMRTGKDFRMSGYPSKIRSLSWSHDSQYLAAAGADSATVWPFAGGDPSGKPPYEFGYSFQGIVTQVATHPSQPIVAAGYNNGTLLLGKYPSGEALIARAPKGVALSALAWNYDGSVLLAGTESGDLCFLSLKDVSF